VKFGARSGYSSLLDCFLLQLWILPDWQFPLLREARGFNGLKATVVVGGLFHATFCPLFCFNLYYMRFSKKKWWGINSKVDHKDIAFYLYFCSSANGTKRIRTPLTLEKALDRWGKKLQNPSWQKQSTERLHMAVRHQVVMSTHTPPNLCDLEIIWLGALRCVLCFARVWYRFMLVSDSLIICYVSRRIPVYLSYSKESETWEIWGSRWSTWVKAFLTGTVFSRLSDLIINFLDSLLLSLFLPIAASRDLHWRTISLEKNWLLSWKSFKRVNSKIRSESKL